MNNIYDQFDSISTQKPESISVAAPSSQENIYDQFDEKPPAGFDNDVDEAKANIYDQFDNDLGQTGGNIYDQFDEPEEKPGPLSNAGRLLGTSAAHALGDVAGAAGKLSDSLTDASPAWAKAKLYWDGSSVFPSIVSGEEYEKLQSGGKIESALSVASDELGGVDLGGERRNTTDNVKSEFKDGDVLGTVGAVIKFSAETMVESIPYMISLPATFVSMSERIADQRAKNDGREESNIEDLMDAAPFALGSAILERAGAKGITGAGKKAAEEVGKEAIEGGVKAVLKEGGKAGTKEAGTEFFQEGVLEYIGERFGTDAAMDWKEGAERGGWAALAGGTYGAASGGAVATGRNLIGDSTPTKESALDRDIEGEGNGLDVGPVTFENTPQLEGENVFDQFEQPLALPAPEGINDRPFIVTPEGEVGRQTQQDIDAEAVSLDVANQKSEAFRQEYVEQATPEVEALPAPEGFNERPILVDSEGQASRATIQDLDDIAATKQKLSELSGILIEAKKRHVAGATKDLKETSKALKEMRKIDITAPINPSRDELQTMVAKLGGIQKEEAVAQGFDPAVFKDKVGLRNPFRKNGMTMDAMAEALSQYGVLPEAGYTANGLVDILQQSIAGDPVYANEAGEYVGRMEELIANEDELVSRSQDAGKDIEGLTNDERMYQAELLEAMRDGIPVEDIEAAADALDYNTEDAAVFFDNLSILTRLKNGEYRTKEVDGETGGGESNSGRVKEKPAKGARTDEAIEDRPPPEVTQTNTPSTASDEVVSTSGAEEIGRTNELPISKEVDDTGRAEADPVRTGQEVESGVPGTTTEPVNTGIKTDENNSASITTEEIEVKANKPAKLTKGEQLKAKVKAKKEAAKKSELNQEPNKAEAVGTPALSLEQDTEQSRLTKGEQLKAKNKAKKEADKKSEEKVKADTGISVEVEVPGQGEIHGISDTDIERLRKDLLSDDEFRDTHRGTAFLKRLRVLEDGRGTTKTITEYTQWARDWLDTLNAEESETERQMQSAKKDAASYAEKRLKKQEKDRSIFRNGEAPEGSTKRYGLWVKSLTPAQREKKFAPGAVTNNADYFAFVSKMKSLAGDKKPELFYPSGEIKDQDGFDNFIEEEVLKPAKKEPSPTTSGDHSLAEAGAKDLKGGSYPIAYHNSIIKSLKAGELTAEKFHEAYETLVANEADVRGRLNKYNKDKLFNLAGQYRDNSVKKGALINSAFERIESFYELNKEVPSFSFYFGGDIAQKRKEHNEKVREIIRTVTQEDIDAAYQERIEQAAAKKEAKAEQEQALADPKTLNDFRTYVRAKGLGDLSADQLAMYDALGSDFLDEARRERLERDSNVEAIDVDGLSFETTETTHSKKGTDLFVVKLAGERLPKEQYAELRDKAKKFGGYYSSYSKDGAIPGFQFFTDEDRASFVALLEGDDVNSADRRERRAKEKSLTRAERMMAKADEWEAKGEEKLGQDRQTNTSRRATQAAHAEADARDVINNSRILRAIAQGISDGSVTALAGVQAATHIDAVSKTYEMKKYHKDAESLTHKDDNSRKYWNEDADINEIARLIDFPAPYAYTNTLLSMAKDMDSKTGFKATAKQIDKALTKFVGKQDENHDLKEMFGGRWPQVKEKIKAFAKKNPTSYTAERIKDTFADEDRLHRAGITHIAQLRQAVREYLRISRSIETEKVDPLKEKERELIGKKDVGLDFFPTPPQLMDQLISEAGIEKGMRVLEPSAGKGDIADALREAGGDVEVVELSSTLRELLELKGHNIIEHNFDDLEGEAVYDRIVMNPPFSNDLDIQHVRKAYDLLKPEGRLVAIVSGMAGRRQRASNTEFMEWLEELGGTIEPLPEGSFKSSFRPTGVSTQLVVIDKAQDSGAAMFSLDDNLAVTEPTTTVTEQEASRVIDGITADWRGGNDRVSLARTFDDLPSEVKDEAKRQNAEGKVRGIFQDGQIHIILDKHSSTQDIEETLLHEAYGHYGFNSLFGQNIRKTMNQIYIQIGGSKGLNTLIAKHGIKVDSYFNHFNEQQKAGKLSIDQRNSLLMEEVLSRVAEQSKPSVNRRYLEVIGAIRQWLVKHGFLQTAKMSDSEIMYILKRSRDVVTEGKEVNGGEPMLMVVGDKPLAAMFSRQEEPGLSDIADRVLATPQSHKPIATRIKEWIGQHLDRRFLRQGFVDQFDSIMALEKAVKGGLLDASESAYKAAAFSKNASTVLETAMHVGGIKYSDGSIEVDESVKGLMDIMEPLADAGLVREWELWAGAKRAKRLLKEGKERNYTAEDIKSVEEAVNANTEKLAMFESIHSEWITYNKSILDFSEAAGLINSEQRALWEKDDYVPFHRVSELEGKQEGDRSKGGLSGQKSGIKSLEGGVEKISIVESMVRNTGFMIESAMKNVAMQRTIDLAVETGAVDRVADASISTDEAAERLDALGVDYTKQDIKTWAKLLEKYDARHGTVSVSVNGETQRYVVHDPLLLQSLVGLGPTGADGIMRILRIPKRLLTDMVTADPSFALRNWIRDTLSTWVTVHGLKRNPLTDAIRGVIKSYKNNPSQIDMMAQGVGGGGFYDTSPEGARAHLDKLNGRGGVKQGIKELWQGYRRILGTTENANRIAVYENVLKAGSSKAEAAYEAMDVLNFTRHGDFKAMRVLIQLVPFMNARVQGLDKLQRGAKEGTQEWYQFNRSFMVKGTILTGATLALLAQNWDNEDYWDLPEWERDTYYHFFNGDEHYRMPKPFEVGSVFSTVPERMFEQFRKDANSKLLGQRMLRMVADTFAFDPTPQFIKPVVEIATNTHSFTGRSIVSEGLKNSTPEAQYSPYTSKTFIELADAMPNSAPEWMRSPVKLEHLYRGYFGTLGSYVMMASDYLARTLSDSPARPELRFRDTPIAQSFIRDGVGTNKQVVRVYDMSRAVNRLHSSIRKYQKEGNFDKAREVRTDNIEKLRSRAVINKAVRRMSKISSEMRRIYDSETMTPAAKRKRLDWLIEKRNELSKKISERYWNDF